MKRVRRSFDDWVIVLGDGLMAVLAGFFAIVVLIAGIASGSVSFGRNDKDRT